MFATFNSKDQSVFFRIIKQTAWDEKTQKPSFAGGATFNLKLSPDEVGEIIHAISKHTSWKFYHSFGEEATTGSFGYWEKEYKGKDGNPAKSCGFGLSAKKGETLVKIGFSLGAAERLSQYLQFALDHMHSAIYSQDKKEQEEYFKKRDAAAAPANTQKAGILKKRLTEFVEGQPLIAALKTKDVEEVESEEAPPEVVEEEEDSVVW